MPHITLFHLFTVLIAVLKGFLASLPAMQEIQVQSLGREIPWRREWQPAPVFLPGESQGRWSLMGCRLWGRTESDTTE